MTHKEEMLEKLEAELAEAKAGWDSAIADLRKAADICRGVCRGVEKDRDSWRRVAEKLETALVAANERIAQLQKLINESLKASMDGN